MAEQIISASGTQYGLIVNADGSIKTVVSGLDVSIGSLSVNLESIYVTSGNVALLEQSPTSVNNNNFKTVLQYSGTALGSLWNMNSTGSFVKVLVYDGSDNLVSVGPWVGV